MKKILTIAILLTMATSCAKVEISTPESLSIAGSWQVSLDSLATFQPIQLPGTTDDAGLGEPNTLQPMRSTNAPWTSREAWPDSRSN